MTNFQNHKRYLMKKRDRIVVKLECLRSSKFKVSTIYGYSCRPLDLYSPVKVAP